MSEVLKKYIARITWNDFGWKKPSGDKKMNEDEDNYTVINGYGHEEWLFSDLLRIDNYQYSFIQGAFKTAVKDNGQEVHIYLYTISRKKGWYIVGEISRCHILSSDEAIEAYSFSKQMDN